VPAKEIKELRKSGNLEEALILAKSELEADPENIWAKRNLSWVLYDYLKLNNSPENYDVFLSWLDVIKDLELTSEERILFEQLCWQVGKMAFGLIKSDPTNHLKGIRLFESIQSFSFPMPSEAYSFLFKGFHKVLKDTESYIEFADWWGFGNFIPEDYQKDRMPNGREIMAIAEQAYIAYSKHLLPKRNESGNFDFDREKVDEFLPLLSEIVDNYPDFQYPAYFEAKLLLAIGERENVLESLLPFARKKRNDFWVWQILAEPFSEEPEKVFACYCKALSCRSPEEMLVSLRQKMAGILIKKNLFNEAKTEIELLIRARKSKGFNIPTVVTNWQSSEWFESAKSSKSNIKFYATYTPMADAILFEDMPEDLVFVENVNTQKKILNFVVSEFKFGFFKYDRFLSKVEAGDTLKVRFQEGASEGIHQIYSAVKVEDEAFRNQFIKEVSGKVNVPNGKAFGFVDDVFIHPSLVAKYKLSDGLPFTGKAIKSYNSGKKQWGWKLF